MASTLSYNTNSGGAVTAPASKTIYFNETYGTLPTLTRTGYTFNGWFTATSGGDQILSTTTVTVTSNQTLYAQ